MTTMEISASMVRDLRDKTGAGMMQCKKALAEANGDMEAAIDILRKQGAAVAAKRADKEAKEGKVFLLSEGSRVAIMEMNCETDFVGSSPDFVNLGNDLIKAAVAGNISDVSALMQVKLGDLEAQTRLNELVGKIGENISVRKLATLSVEANETVALYSHMGGKIGVAVKLGVKSGSAAQEKIVAIAKDLAMQVAATSPISISEADVDPAVIAKEREIYKEQALAEGTKPDFVDKKVDGRVKKFLKEVCLQEQVYVKDNKTPVTDPLASLAKETGTEAITITHFTRFELGK